MDAQHVKRTGGRGSRRWTFALAALAMACGGAAWAQVVSVPAAHLNHAEGSVAYAPQGDTEWQDVQPRRVLKRGDRLWTDRGSRAELQAGGHALRLDSQTQLILENVVENATQLSLTQGSVAFSVTRMQPGDSFEIGTPNLAFRARAVGDYRIDVDSKQGVTRVAVLTGAGVVYGEKGEAMEVRNGQRVIFRERNLARGPQAAFAATDDFDRWAGARRRGEPTVSMPTVAESAPVAPPTTTLVNKGRDIIISGPAASLPGSKLAAAPGPLAKAKMPPAQLPPMAAAPAPAPQVAPAKAQPIPNLQVGPAHAGAAALRVTAPGTAAQAAQADAARAAAETRARAEAQAAARAQAQAEATARAEAAAEKRQAQQAKAAQARAAREQREQKRLAAKRAAEEEQERAEARAAAVRAEQQRRTAMASAEAKRAEERRSAVAAKKAEEERRLALARREAEQKQEQKRAIARREEERRAAVAAAARKAAEEKRVAQARKAEEERRIVQARKAEEARLADARRQQLARLQEQAGREEQTVQARRAQQAREAEAKRQRELQARQEQAQREELARREEESRQRALAAEQARREEVWLRQQQVNPPRPQPLGIPIRRVS
jgi:DNA segregation ATPase FtsK/SpoIIIE-like protein